MVTHPELTAALIDAATYEREDNKAQYIWDHVLAGFGVRLYPSGRKVWVAAWRTLGRKRIKVLGAVGSPMGIVEARETARARISGNAAEAGTTVRELCEGWARVHSRKRMAGWREHQWVMYRFIVPALGDCRLDEVTLRRLLEQAVSTPADKRVVADTWRALLAFAAEGQSVGPTVVTRLHRHVLRYAEHDGGALHGAVLATRQRIIDAATQLLSERPMKAVTVREVADAAGVSVGALYRQFADKPTLMLEVLDRFFGFVLLRFQSLGHGVAEDDALAQVSMLYQRLEFLLAHHLEHPGIFLTWYRHGYGIRPQIDARIDQFKRDLEEIMSAGLSASGTVTIPDPMMVASLLLGMGLQLLERVILDKRIDPQRGIEVTLQMVLGGLSAYAEGAPALPLALLRGR